jgi:hypothetical protein
MAELDDDSTETTAEPHMRIIRQIDADLAEWHEAYEAHKDDVRFAVQGGEAMWDPNEYASRTKLEKPIITYNVCQPIIRTVSNGVIGRNYAVTLSADGFGATSEEAEFRAGVIRAIRISGKARQAMDFALKNAVAGGIGVYRIVIDEDQRGQKRIAYRRIKNSCLVVPDPEAQDAAFADMRRCAVYEDIPNKAYKKQWPEGKAMSVSTDNAPSSWISGDEKKGSVRVAEYWEVEGEGPEAKIYQTIVDAGGILQERKLQPGRWIPIFFVLGDEYDVDGKRILKGVIRDAKDPQRMLNLWESVKLEWLDGRRENSPIVTPTMIADPDIRATWSGDGRNAFRMIEPDPSFNGGMPFFPDSPSVPVGFSEAAQEAAQMVKVTSGIYDERLGAKTSASSGRAVALRQEQSEVSTAHFEEALRAAIEHECRVINDMLPDVYTGRELLAFATEDGKLEQREIGGVAGIIDWKKKFGFNGGMYGVRVVASPDFKTRREQFLSFFSEIATKNQLIGTIGAPEMIRAIDLPGGEALAVMLEENLVKQGLRTPPEQQEIPVHVRAQMEQQNQMIDQLTQRLEQMTQERGKIIEAAENDKAQIKREASVSADLEKAKLDAQVAIEKAQLDARTRLQVAEIQRRTDLQIAEINAMAKIATAPTIPDSDPAPIGTEIDAPELFLDGTAPPVDVVFEAGTAPGGEYP